MVVGSLVQRQAGPLLDEILATCMRLIHDFLLILFLINLQPISFGPLRLCCAGFSSLHHQIFTEPTFPKGKKKQQQNVAQACSAVPDTARRRFTVLEVAICIG